MRNNEHIMMVAAWKVTTAIQEDNSTFDSAYDYLIENCAEDIAQTLVQPAVRRNIAALVSGFLKMESDKLDSMILAIVRESNAQQTTMAN